MSQIEYKVVVTEKCIRWYKPNTKIPHRIDGPAIEYKDGSKSWHINGKRHRLDGPAYEGSDGAKEWFFDDKRHRLDGPAIEWADGSKEWFIDGKLVTETEHKSLTAPKPTCDGKLVEIDGVKYKLTLV